MACDRPGPLDARALSSMPSEAATESHLSPRDPRTSLTRAVPWKKIFSMITTVTQKNMVTIPAEVGRKLGIKPGWRLDWQPVEGREEILVRVIPDRGERARRLLGAGRKFSPGRDAVSELVAERASEG
jgi:AbrB family looped-hinge helix DNA binding protein